MKRFAYSIAFINLLVSGGCSIAGKWTLVTVEPEAARRDVEFASLTLQRDGSFYAEAHKDVPGPDVVVVGRDTTVVTGTDKGGIQSTSGTYEYKSHTLALQPHDGPVVAYDARLNGAELQLERYHGAQRVKCKYKRVE